MIASAVCAHPRARFNLNFHPDFLADADNVAMLIIPAIDLKNGKCVRLVQGRMQEETIYSEDPEAVARRWATAGATMLHVVDLDAAVHGALANRTRVAGIIRAAGIPVQVGGGMRDLDAVTAHLESGAQRVVIGTAAVENPAFVREACRLYPGRIAAGIDARQGRVAIRGWTRTTETLAVDLSRQLEDAGVCVLIFTDIQRDGMQVGPNIDETRKLAASVGIPVIASGGVGTLDHIRSLMALEAVGVTGVITGKALYSGALRLEEALALTRSAPALPGSPMVRD
jgi:phosphoribosylformimino-5-aminoimidazole carboxamide ribotide isomerase